MIDLLLNSNKNNFLIYIYQLSLKSRAVRSVDLARAMNLSKASISMTLNKLIEKGYIDKESYGDIYLTPEGTKEAKKLYEQHLALSSYFQNELDFSSEDASKNSLICLCTFSNQNLEQWVHHLELKEAYLWL